MSSLLVIIPDGLSYITDKGEVTSRYYNPGDLFDEVHILMINDNQPDPSAVQPMVGRAKLHLHNLPIPQGRYFHKTLGWRPTLMRPWTNKGVELARKIKPDLVRCHGPHFNALIASEIKRELGIPYAVSLHINPDVDVRARATHWKQKVLLSAVQTCERVALRNADIVLPVYKSILPYTTRMGAQRVEVVYNALNPDNLTTKESYELGTPPSILSVGRIIDEKYPINPILAAHELGAFMTVVGDGPKLAQLQEEVREKGAEGSVEFIPAINNDELCRKLPEYDIFSTHSEYFEFSKSIREPLVTGLPVVLNHRKGEPVPEFVDANFLMLVDNTFEGYTHVFEQLLSNQTLREDLGRKAFNHSKEHWPPLGMELRVLEIYKELLNLRSKTRA